MSRPSPSPSPGPPASNGTSAANKASRQSMGPSARPPAGLAPISPRPSGSAVRPTSELLGATSFQTPEVEAIDQWFENLQNYEATLEEMAAASLDVNFKEELSAIEQWFRVLSEAERTAALYSLLQHSTQVQIRFFITVLQQMARSDPMTALLSPGMGGSMQAQMEAKLASMGLKSPGLPKAPPSPSSRNFSGGAPANFLSPDTAALASPNPEAAATLAQQRARLKASSADAASRRISAPGTLLNAGDGRNVWQSPQLDQVAERAPSPVPEAPQPSSSPSPGPTNTSSARPKSTDFTGLANQLKPRVADVPKEEVLSPMGTGNWASMVNTPLVPMFAENNASKQQNLDAAASKLTNWSKTGSSGARIALADPQTFRRSSKTSSNAPDQNSNSVYGDDGNLIVPGTGQQHGRSGGMRNVSGGSTGFGNQTWGGMQNRSPSLSNVSSGRFNQDEMAAAAMLPFGMTPQMPLGMSPLMGGLAGFNMMGMGMGMDPIQAQYLAAQLAAGQFGQQFTGMQNQNMMRNAGRSTGRTTGSKSSLNGRESSSGAKDKDDEVDPALLNDIPAWLRSLRLHKYTPNFEGMSWKEMVIMDEPALEAKGVAALGARRKMLKTFEAVRNKMGITLPGEAGNT